MAKNSLDRRAQFERNLGRQRNHKLAPVVDWGNYVSDPERVDADTIDCIFAHPEYGEVPYTARRNDPEQHGREIFEYLEGVLDA